MEYILNKFVGLDLFKGNILTIFARIYYAIKFIIMLNKGRLFSKGALLLLLALILFTQCSFFSKKHNTPRNIKGVISYKRSFGDLNPLHLEIAKKRGVDPHSTRENLDMKKLKKIETNKWYVVDSLTHSVPYLVPNAYNLLELIGVNFRDSLASKGLNPYSIIVTSVLRTQDDVKRLRKRNINASANSAHCYGTTFDVSWKRYEQIPHRWGREMETVSSDTLKLVLSEVLRDLKKEELCYIKYELKQGCFHITAR